MNLIETIEQKRGYSNTKTLLLDFILENIKKTEEIIGEMSDEFILLYIKDLRLTFNKKEKLIENYKEDLWKPILADDINDQNNFITESTNIVVDYITNLINDEGLIICNKIFDDIIIELEDGYNRL